ncbi:MAG: peptide chain release factor-like protein [Robiginitomaculum sp.]|nr:MAG: peptide chain release factor-like protein [Robiginitomaculum sp.]
MPNRNELLDMNDDNLLRHCRQECYRASGPGGQHRNTTDSAVRLTVLDGSVVALCADHRSQHRNRAEALKRLRSAIAIQLRLPIAPDSASGSKSERWQGSWTLGKKDRRYAGFIAHLLDILAHYEWAVGLAAKGLGISTGKLVRVLAKDPHAWNAVNQARAKLDLVNLRRP